MAWVSVGSIFIVSGLQYDEALGASAAYVTAQKSAIQRQEDGRDQLWRRFWEDPTQWHKMQNRELLKVQELNVSRLGEDLGIDHLSKPYPEVKHSSLNDSLPRPGALTVEQLWQHYFKNPTESWDKKSSKHSKSTYFRQEIAKKEITSAPREAPLFRKAGSTSPSVEGPLGNYTDFRNEFHWTALISQHVKSGQTRRALSIYEDMLEAGVACSSYTYVAALKACSNLKDLESARHIHVELVKHGFESDVYVGTMLVDVYGKCGSLIDARRVFEEMPHRTVVSWNALILVYAQMGEGEEALQLYTQMHLEGVLRNDRTFVGALKACSSLAALEEGVDAGGTVIKRRSLDRVRAIHSHILRSGFESDVFVGTMLVDVYAKCGSLVDARSIFEKMPHRNVVSWTAMILAYAQMEEGELALQLFERMQMEGLVPNDRTFLGALKACSSLAEMEEACGGVEVLVRKRCLGQARIIHSEAAKKGSDSDVFVGTMLVDVYAKCGSLREARLVFDKMPSRDVVAWNAMILGCAQMEQADEALQLYTRMQQESVLPNHRTFVAALKACGVVAGLEMGKEIHYQICKVGPEAHGLYVPTSLIDMYGKCASMVDAQQVFDALATRDIVTWSALIAGYARQGASEIVFDLFERMIHEGIQPNKITFLSVLSVCSHMALVDEGQQYFDVMSREYGIAPTIEHYNCMIDVLGRSGQLAKAMAMVKTMPFQPDLAVWRTVLGACRKWHNVELGRQAFEYALRLDKADPSIYVLMANIYCAAHMWGDAEGIKAMRVSSGACKQPGQSWWADLRGKVHTFLEGNLKHPKSQDIYARLGNLLLDMKALGYVPYLDSVLLNMPGLERQDALCGHSEILATVYALLKTPQGTTIRVVKNPRVCEDCHTATALISKIEQRTIICRDATCFHVYKDGKCSCGGFW